MFILKDLHSSMRFSGPRQADIPAPGLTRHQFSCFFPQAKGGLADAFQTSFDCITPECVASKPLRKFSLFAHFEGVEREAGIEGTLTQMIRGKDRWIWIIPITAKKTSIGVVLDAQTFKKMKLEPAEAFDQILQENPEVTKQLLRAHRVTEVHATGDFSFRNKRFTGARWVLAGDAAGFIDPVWSSGVFIAILSGENVADMLDRVLRQPERRAAEFARYERRLGRVMDLYLKLVTAWYTQEFAEVFFHPQKFLQLVPAVNSVLAGTEERLPEVRWRLWIFYLLVFLQKRFAMIAPRMSLQPK